MVGHLIFLRPQVLASSGISFESTMIHVTPNIPLLYLLCTCFDNVFDKVKMEDILEAAISDLKATFVSQENTKELISRIEEIMPIESQKYEVVNVTGNDVRFKATIKTKSLKDEGDIENFVTTCILSPVYLMKQFNILWTWGLEFVSARLVKMVHHVKTNIFCGLIKF